jgi:hypothetical protein
VQPARNVKKDNNDTKCKPAFHVLFSREKFCGTPNRITGDNRETVLNIFSRNRKTPDTAVHHEIAPPTLPQTPSNTRSALFVVALGDWRFGPVVHHARSGGFSPIRKTDLREVVFAPGWHIRD